MPPSADVRFDALMQSALELSAEHEVDQVLDRVVRCAATVAGAEYAALGVYDSSGRIERFVHHGLEAEAVARIGPLPEGRGLLGEVIVTDGPIRVADIGADPRSCGFPHHHPPMRSFLGVPVRVAGRRYGNLYLTEKVGGREFDADDEQLVVTLAAFAACAIEAALLVAAEHDRAAAMAELAAAQERARAQREVLTLVIEAQEAERARVSRDLHDQIGQALTSVLLGLRLVDGSFPEDRGDLGEVRERTSEVRELVTQALDEVRQLAFDLRPTVLDDVGLVAAVTRLADLTRRSGIPVELALVGLDDESRLPAEVETVVYRVVQEALTNVSRHAEASLASIAIEVEVMAVRAVIADDGVGFVVGDGPPRSLGLAGMVERASLVGGHVEIVSTPAEGTTVVLEVPR